MATIANTGLVIAVKLLNNVDTPTPFTYMALGKGVGVESSEDEALGNECTEAGLTRKVVTCSYESGYKARWVGTFTNNTASTVGVNEMGIFNAASVGTMLLRHKYSDVQNILPDGSAEFSAEVTHSVGS